MIERLMRRVSGLLKRDHTSPESALDDRARAIIDSYRTPRLDAASEDFVGRIEVLRGELMSRQDPLTWDRPWLSHSEELRERLNLTEGQDFEITLTVAEATKASRGKESCRSLLSLTRHLKPAVVLEMGTNVGVSGAFISAGLELQGSGQLTTLEGSPSKGELARKNFASLGISRAEVVVGDFADTLEPVLERLGPIDLAFIDGFHEGAATLHYHELCKRKAAPKAVFLYDDINWSKGMAHAWSRIVADPDVAFTATHMNVGICGLR